jgi:ABC-type dipeptide/oligopeptide/nickel transport system permease component
MTKLGTFIVKTSIRMLVTYITILALFFVVVRVLPILILGPEADPVLVMLKKGAEDPRFGDWAIVTAKKYGYGQPLYVQFIAYMKSTLQFDFGSSFYTQVPAIESIALRLPYTLSLYTAATILPILIGYQAGIVSAKYRGGKIDSVIVQLGIISYILPAWLVLLILYYFLSYLPKTKWDFYVFPLPVRPPSISLIANLNFQEIIYALWYVTPLIFAAIIAWTGGWVYMVRQLIVSELGQDYVITALAKGLSVTGALKKHVIPNLKPPLIMALAFALPAIFGGAIIFEAISNWPGIAALSLNAFTTWDFPLMMAFFTISTILQIVSLLIAEIIIAILDPRVRVR